MKTQNSQHSLPSGSICQRTRRGMISLITSLVVWGITLLSSAPSQAADVNVLIIGSTRDAATQWGFTNATSQPFTPTQIRTELQNILGGAGLGTVNVVFEDMYSSDMYGVTPIRGPNLAQWFYYPYPANVETTTRWPNLRGEGGTNWDYVVLIEDPYTIENLPGWYCQGVAAIADEIAKSNMPKKPQTVLLMPWPAATSTSTVAHYKEVVYRVGNTTGCKVAPAALAWQAAGSPVGATHPTTAGAYIAASTIYSTLWGQSAAASTYNYNDTLANTAHTTVTSNTGIQQYTGIYNAPAPSGFRNDKRRTWNNEGTSKSSDFMTRDVLNNICGANRMLWGGSYSRSVWMTWQSSYNQGYPMCFYFDFPGNDNGTLADGFIAGIPDDLVDSEKIRVEGLTTTKLRYLPNHLMWANYSKLYPAERPILQEHYSYDGRAASAGFMYTLFSGRCPLDRKPNPVTKTWDATRIGYETAWRLGKLQGRAPGFRTLPSSADRLKMSPGQTETMTVQFVLPLKADVTVNVSVSNPNVASVSPSQLTFTPGNYTTDQQVVVTCLANADPSSLIRVNFNTVSTDEICNGLNDSWDYDRSFPPVIVQAPWVDVNPITLPTKAWVNVTASDPESDVLTYTWSKVSGPGTATFSPNTSTTSNRSEVTFSKPGTYVLKAMVSDGTSSVNGGEVTVQVLNSVPVANAQSVTAFQGSPKPITLTATDGNGDPLTYVVWDDPLHGTLTGTGANLVYTPASGYLGSDSFTFLVNDGYGNSSPATVSITVLPPNTPPGVNAGTDQTVVLQEGPVLSWTPAEISKAAWFDAADASTITASTGAVSQWRDKSGNAKHLNQATSAARPKTGTRTIGGLNAMEFDGTDDVLTATQNRTPSITIFGVVLADAGSGTDGSRSWLSAPGGSNPDFWMPAPANADTLYAYMLDTTGSISSGSLTAVRNSAHMIGAYSWVAGGAGGGVRVDGGTRISTVAKATTMQQLATELALGRQKNTSGRFHDGLIGEVIIINSRLTEADPDFLRIEGYLAHKWGLTANLPAGHPYKLLAPTKPNASAVANLAGTAIDAEGDPLTTTWSHISGPASTAFGNVSSPVTTATFTQTGTYVLRLNAADSYGQVFDEVTVTVTDSSGNSAPVASNASITTGENIAKAIALSANDAQGNALSYVIVSPPAHGTLSGTAPNLIYTPTAGYFGSDSFTFKANDGVYDSNVATVSITVIPNLAPVIVVDSPTVSLAHLAPYGGVWVETTVTDDGYPLNPGAVTLNWSKVSGPGTVTFETPTQADTAIKFSSGGTFVVRLTATDGAKQSTRDLTLLFGSYPTDESNQGPQVSSQGGLTGAPGIPVSLNGAVFVDDEGKPFGTLTSRWQMLSGPGAGAFADPTVQATTFVCNTAGVYILRIIADDGQVKAFDDLIVTISGTGNAIPIATPQMVSTAEDTSRLITLSGTDGNGSPLTYSVVAQPLNGTLSGTAPNLTYTPASNFTGADSFTFKVNDGITDSLTTATVSITVSPVNDAPVASAMNVTADEDMRLPISLAASDVDGDALVFSIVGQPAHGTLSGTGTGMKYTPSANYTGSDSYRFRATDPSGLFSEAVVSIAVISLEDVPVANPQSVLAVKNTPKLIVLSGTDGDNDPLTYSIIDQPLHGTLDASNLPNVTYTPDVNYFGTDRFMFKVNDGKADSIVAQVSITVQAVGLSSVDRISGLTQDAGVSPIGYFPNANNGTVGGSGSANQRIVTNVVLGHGLPVLPQGAVITGATLNFEITGTNNITTQKLQAYLLDSANPATSGTSFFYNGPANTTASAKYLNAFTAVGAKQTVLSGEALDILKSYYGGDHIPDRMEVFFRFNLDIALTAGSQTRYLIGTGATQNSLSIQYTFVTNTPPAANAQSVTTAEDTAKTISLTGSDADGNPLTYTIVSQPVNGSLSGTAPNVTYTPTANYNGNDSFTFKVNDGLVDSAVATVSIMVTPVNDAPVANTQSVTTAQSTAKAITLTGSDAEGNPLTYVIVTQPAHGTLSGTAPNVTYTPAVNYNGNDSFTFKVNDGTVDSPAATVSLTVTAVNAPPVVNAGADQTVALTTAVPWTPAQISTVGWYDAADAATITASSNAVSQWRDKSGNSRHLNQGTVVNQPATGATINSLNALDFTGDVMTTSSNPFGATINNAFVIAVHKVDAVANGTLFSLTGSSTVGNRWNGLAPYGDGIMYFDCGTASSPNRISASYGVSAGNVVLASFYCSTANNVQQVHKNGSLLVSDASGHAVNTAGNIMVGGVASSYQDTTLGEFIIINGTVDVATRQKLEGYLAHKWGQAANLPADHPYKTAAPTISSSSALANLDGTVSDANGDPLTTTWSFVSGPGSVTFGNASAVDTTATFTVAGTYTLRLTASDGSGPVSDTVVITVTQSAAGAYDTWFAAAGLGGGVNATFNGDANNDGMANGLSWLLGGTNPQQNSNELLPQAAQSSGNLTLSFKMLNSTQRGSAVLALQYSRDLGVSDPWTNHTITVPDISGTVSGVNFVITPISGTDHNQVQVTIPASAAGGTGKVFARMSGMLSP